MINPYTTLYGWWCAFVLFTDATYTAFVVPIGVGFNTSSVQWDWVGYFDFIAGEALQDQTQLEVSIYCLHDTLGFACTASSACASDCTMSFACSSNVQAH